MTPATLPPAVSACLHPSAAITEAELQEKYLGDDLDEICSCAVATGDPVFLASAALPLAKRRAAVAHWRAKRIREMLKDPDFQRFFNAVEAGLRESITSGELTLAAVSAQAAAYAEEVAQRRNAARAASKEAIRAAVQAALLDGEGAVDGAALPGFLAILETGEVGIFRRRTACLEWARSAGCRFFLGVFDTAAHRIFPGLEVD